MQFDYLRAIKDGASPEGIAEFLSKEKGFNLQAALADGVPLNNIIKHLSGEPEIGRAHV